MGPLIFTSCKLISSIISCMFFFFISESWSECHENTSWESSWSSNLWKPSRTNAEKSYHMRHLHLKFCTPWCFSSSHHKNPVKLAEPAEPEIRYAPSTSLRRLELSSEKITDIQREPRFLAFIRSKNKLGGKGSIGLGSDN